MLQRTLVKDLQNITQISSKVFQKLTTISEMVICDDINEMDMLGEDILEVDIGFGKILFLIAGNTLKYEFYPSETFEENIIKTLEEKMNPIVLSAETSLNKKLFNTYKELL